MAEEVNSIDSSSESWKSRYFSIEERDFVQPDTGEKKRRMYYVCKLMKAQSGFDAWQSFQLFELHKEKKIPFRVFVFFVYSVREWVRVDPSQTRQDDFIFE